MHRNRYFDWHRDTTKMEMAGKNEHRSHNALLVQARIYLQDNTTTGGAITLVPLY